MAGESNRDLWQFITGTSFLHPKELVGAEIRRNKDKILKGLKHYQTQKHPFGERLKVERNVDGRQLECVLQISKFIGLDDVLTYDIYCSYLIHEYRASKQELQNVLNTERHLQQFILKVRDYYFTERLYLLQCLKHTLSSWQDDNHPYVEQYCLLVKSLYETDDFIKGVIRCYKEICEQQAPTRETRGNLMTDRQGSVWLQQNLKEQCKLLEIIFLYFKNVEHSAESLCDLLTVFKRQGFGRRQLNKHLLDEVMDPIMSRIGFLQVMLIVEGVDLEDLQERSETSGIGEHHILKSPLFKELDILFNSLGDIPPHGPLVLLWSAVHQLAFPGEAKSQVTVKKCGNKALDLRVFPYINACLKMEPFNGKTMTASVCNTVVYGLLCAVLHCFEESTLGDGQGLYELSSTILSRNFLAEDFWERGENEGLGTLLQSASLKFPLDAKPLLSLSSSLSGASRTSSLQMITWLQRLPIFTEFLNNRTEVESTPEPMYWRLMKERRPYSGHCNLAFPKGIMGRILTHDDKIVQWEYPYDGFDVFMGELESLLSQISYGAGMVQRDTLEKVTDCCKLIHALMSVDAILVQEAVHQLWLIIDLCYQVIQRFSQLATPPLDLIASCLNIVTEAIRLKPTQIWHSMQQTALLPFLTENIDNLAEICSGAGLNAGCYGRILAGMECTQGNYPVTMAVLNFISNLVMPLHQTKKVDSLMACILFVSREIFPVFHKWRYYTQNTREKIGQKSLEIFHRVLNLLGQESSDTRSGETKLVKSFTLRDVTVSTLLFTESGKTLLDIIDTGVDNVEIALAAQGSATEGSGVELIHLIRFAFSVLNRLLLLRPEDAPSSPVEHCLSARPANRASRHVVATIAQYMYHRHDSRLPTLATLLLKRIAMIYPMSILACLGNDAEPIRDIYLSRLQATTEDVHLKVGVLELLTVCVETQPGLIETFLNLSEVIASDKKTSEGKKDWSMGKRSCLHTILSLIEEKKQGGYQCPAELLCAVVDFLHALWLGRRETAMAVLREKTEFWPSLCLSLTRDLQNPYEVDVEQQVLAKEIKTCSNIMRILAQELYWLNNDNPDKRLQEVIQNLTAKDRPQYWSEYCVMCMRVAAEVEVKTGDVLSDNTALQLVLGLRNFILVVASSKIPGIRIKGEAQSQMLKDLLECIEVQFTCNSVTELNVKLASITSAFYLSLLKNWIGSTKDFVEMLNKQVDVIELTCTNTETLLPSVLIGLLGAVAHMLQYVRQNEITALKGLNLASSVKLVCNVIQQNTSGLVPDKSVDGSTRQDDVKLKLVCVCLLQELLTSLGDSKHWLSMLQKYAVVQCLLSSVQTWMQCQQGVKYVNSVMMLFLTLSQYTDSAEVLSLSGTTHSLCLTLASLYSGKDVMEIPGITPRKVIQGNTRHLKRIENKQEAVEIVCKSDPWKCKFAAIPETVRDRAKQREFFILAGLLHSVGDADSDQWLTVYHHGINLMTSLLTTLKYNFLQDALNFVGVHQERMAQCLNCTGTCLSPLVLHEASETCRFVYQLSFYRKDWFLHLPTVLQSLMTNLCMLSQRSVSLLIRPRLLQHFIEKRTSKEEQQVSAKLLMTPISRRLSQQSVSVDESETIPQDVVQIQHKLLDVVAWCVAALKQFSPDLCEILLDQSVDISEYEPILEIGFSTPGVEQNSQPSFGTLLSCTNMCVRIIAKTEGRSMSPSRSTTPEVSGANNRSKVLFVMENSLLLCMSQAIRYLKDPGLSIRDKQLLKRELGTELNSILAGLNRHMRKTPSSPSTIGLISPQSSRTQINLDSPQEASRFITLLQSFVTHLLT